MASNGNDQKPLERQVKEWWKREFNVEVKIEDIQGLLRGKNGSQFTKMFESMVKNVVHKDNYAKMMDTIKTYESKKKVDQLEAEAKDASLSVQEQEMKGVNIQSIREQKAYLSVLGVTADSLVKVASESDQPGGTSFSTGTPIGTLKQHIKGTYDTAQALATYLSICDQSGLQNGGAVSRLPVGAVSRSAAAVRIKKEPDVDSETSFDPDVDFLSPDDLVERIEEEVDKINDLLVELKEMDIVGHRSQEVKIDPDAVRDLLNHTCEPSPQGGANGLAPNTASDIFELNLVEFKKYEEQRKLTKPKLEEKLTQALGLIQHRSQYGVWK